MIYVNAEHSYNTHIHITFHVNDDLTAERNIFRLYCHLLLVPQ